MGQVGETRAMPGIFEQTIFSTRGRIVNDSAFIKAMHPKTEISPTEAAVSKILSAGWAGQLKIHGHRAQIHISSDPEQDILAFNRQGRLHKMLLPEKIGNELRRILNLSEGWTVIDAEWLKPKNKLFIFDILKHNGELLRKLSYGERHKLLPRSYISPHIKTLPLLTTPAKCMEVLSGDEDDVEGLVFKSLTTRGFEDTSIVRCRKRR
jgi:ATP-dependent DNA ligase